MGLLVIRVYSYDCDRTGCDQVSEDVVPGAADGPNYVRYVRRVLRAQGWTFKGRKAFCPGHKEG